MEDNYVTAPFSGLVRSLGGKEKRGAASLINLSKRDVVIGSRAGK